MTQAVVKMQAMVRRRICVMEYHKLRTACIFIQRRIRANRIARKLRQEFILTRCAVIKIQSCYRGWTVRNENRRFKAVCKIQRWYRSILEARKVRQEYCRIVKATVVLQAAYRGYSARLYARKMKAARTIQAVVMVYLARKNMDAQALARRNACILLQRRIRANRIARKLRQEFILTRCAVIKIQACYRGWKVRNESRRFKAACKIERWYRSILEARKVRQEYCRIVKATVVLQAAYRGYSARLYARKMKAARTIQAVVMVYLARKEFKAQSLARRRHIEDHKLRNSCILFQRRIRANRIARKLRQEFILTRCAVIKIQSCYRGWKVRNESRRFKAACKIHRWYRSILEARKVRKEYCRIVKATVVLQAACRGYSARLYARKMKAARTIQAAVRGYLTRNKIQVNCFIYFVTCCLFFV